MQTDPARARARIRAIRRRCPVWDHAQAVLQRGDAALGRRRLPAARASAAVECKKPLIERVVDEITGMRQARPGIRGEPDVVRGIIAEGCEKARAVAGQTLDDVKQAMGIAYGEDST